MHRVSTPVALMVALAFGFMFMRSMPDAAIPARTISAGDIVGMKDRSKPSDFRYIVRD